KGRAIILFYSSLLCVILGYFISLYYGTIGMFIGTAISLFIGQVLMINRYYARTAGLDMRRFFRRTYGPLLLPSAVMILAGLGAVALLTLDNWFSFLAFAFCYGLLAVGTIWFFYLNRDERDMFLGPLQKLIPSRHDKN
ncbi:hypothetical protein, partial [Akkermansia sp.]